MKQGKIVVDYNKLAEYKNRVNKAKNTVAEVQNEYEQITQIIADIDAYKGEGLPDFCGFNSAMNENLSKLCEYLDICANYIDLCIMTSVNENETLAKDWVKDNVNIG